MQSIILVNIYFKSGGVVMVRHIFTDYYLVKYNYCSTPRKLQAHATCDNTVEQRDFISTDLQR